METVRTILHPTDFSARSARAFELACSLAQQHAAKLVVLHVVEVPMVVPGGVMTPPPPVVPEDEWQRLKAQLEAIRPTNTAIAVEHRMVAGDVSTGVLQVADEVKADLIVLGTHGRTGLARLLMGSVAEQVVRKARCPVVTIKIP
jgi:nucleotide-binding universal stress UspA family protein